MKIITNGDLEIKHLAKNLKKELKTFEIDLSHTASLNTVSRILGFANYNTYKAILDKKTTFKQVSLTSGLQKEKPLLFDRIPYEARYWENSYLSIEQAEESITEYLHYHGELIFANIARVFTDNKNNPYNLVLELRNSEVPKSNHWITLDQETGIELIFDKYVSTRREVDSNIVESMLEHNGDLELLEAFKAMVGINDGEIFPSLNEEVFKYNDPESRFYKYRNLLISRQKDVVEIARMYNLDFRPLYNSFKEQ
jgi:hypothetical protein